jgi:hypothetical protein
LTRKLSVRFSCAASLREVTTDLASSYTDKGKRKRTNLVSYQLQLRHRVKSVVLPWKME